MPTGDSRPNILLVITDQHRGDCLSIAGHPVLQTPYLDQIASEGVRFASAYSACPVCIPARRTLMSGQRPCNQGVMMNYSTWLDAPTLPGELSAAGYQTHLCGKLHLAPRRKLYGFDSADWADCSIAGRGDNDYQRFLTREGVRIPQASSAHGCAANGWVARPWHLPEHLHFTNWCVDSALTFLERRDPTVPFFLKVSFIHPHQPCTPPQFYWDRYMNLDLPEPIVGDWARFTDVPVRGGSAVGAWRWAPEPEVMRQFRAGYYGCINHIDDQLGRLMPNIPANTLIIFTADHGEMAGDHQWLRKRTPYEASARVPMLMRFPRATGIAPTVCERPVELMDIMPTCLDLAGVEIPASVDGRSVLPLLRGQDDWREYIHGECAEVPTTNSGMQYLTDGRQKYIWWPGRGEEQFFNLLDDPHECHDLAGVDGLEPIIAPWRERLIAELAGRPEGFTDGRTLCRLDGPTAFCMPGYEGDKWHDV